MNRLIRTATLYVGLAATIFGFHAVESPILFLVGLALLVVIGEAIWFGDDLFLGN